MDGHAKGNVHALVGRWAGPADDLALVQFVRSQPLPGRFELALDCVPSFFGSLQVLGSEPRVLVGEQGGCIAGLGVLTQCLVYFNGSPVQSTYLGLLRLAPAIRNTMALARGYRIMADMIADAGITGPCLTSILEDNAHARAILTSGRAGLPVYREITRYEVCAMPAIRGRRQPPAGVRLCRGSECGARAIAEFLEREGSRRQYYPVYSERDLATGGGRLRGLSLDDVVVAMRDGETAGVLGTWDQSAFRRHVIEAYRGWLRLLRPIGGVLNRLLGRPVLPATGEPIRECFGACLAVQEDDHAVFESLTDAAMAVTLAKGATWLSVGFAADDPFLQACRRRWHVSVRSRIYEVEWPGRNRPPASDGRCPYFEGGCL